MTEENNISAVADQLPHTDGGVTDFMQNFTKQTATASEVAGQLPTPAPASVVTPNTGGGWREKLQLPSALKTEEKEQETEAEAKPLFPDAGKEPEKGKQPKEITLEAMLRVRNEIQAGILAVIAQSNNPERYKMTDEDIDFLAELWLPYWDDIKVYIPNWAPLAVMEVKIVGGIIRRAFQDGKQNKKNTQAVRSGTVAQVVKAAAAGNNPNDPSLERRRFEIDAEGYYRHNRDGSFHYAGTPGGEMPDLTNAEHVERLISKNGKQKVMRIFNITDADLEKLGL